MVDLLIASQSDLPPAMNDIDPDTNCPCESGWLFSQCCGVENRSAVNANIMAVIAADGEVTAHELTEQIRSSITSITGNPDLFPARVDFSNNKSWFVKMSPRWYRESVFLDPGRIKGTFVIEADLSWLQQICSSIKQQPASFIFHTAFCGSTLMSQALDALYQILPLREPEVLGNLLVYQRSDVNEKTKQLWLDCVLRLLSRRYETDQQVVVKVNDYANPLMLALANADYLKPTLFMYTPLNEFLAGCLKANNRREWIAQRYKAIVNVVPHWLNLPENMSIREDSYGKMAAVYWCYNIALYLEAANRSSSQVRSLDFNQMLENPYEVVEAVDMLFGLTLRNNINRSEEIQRLFGMYSKNSQLTYSPEQRINDIAVLLKQNQAELDEAEQLAYQLLGSNYPEYGLPGRLVDS